MKNILAFALNFCLVTFNHEAHGQVKYYNVIKDDSVEFYFDANYNYVPEACADFKRYTHINPTGHLTGPFRDYKGTQLVGKGLYREGKKFGAFETYHDNGKRSSKGYYVNDNPKAGYFFFREDGSLERQLQISTDTLLITYVNNNGDSVIKNGNGIFDGILTVDHTAFSAKGEIKNGLPTGEWTAIGTLTMTDKEIVIEISETFVDGKLVAGTIRKSNQKKKDTYCCASQIKNFIETPYFVDLESFIVKECGPVENRLLNPDALYQDMKTAIDKFLYQEKLDNTEIEMIISFIIDPQTGKPNDFKLEKAATHNTFYPILCSTLKNLTNWKKGGSYRIFMNIVFDRTAGRKKLKYDFTTTMP